MPFKLSKLIDKITEKIARFFGSWWAVIFHLLWFSVWLIFDFSVHYLTLGVSLEAIFIGIFLLMTSNKAEVKRDIKDNKQRIEDMKRVEYDIMLDEKADRKLDEIHRLQKELNN